MIRILLSLFGFLILIVLQSSFIPSLPWIFSATPIIVASSTYLVQHFSLSDGAWWLIAFGLSLDTLNIGQAPLETLSYTLAAIAITIGAKHLFSNRSLYGVIGSALTALTVIFISESIILSLVWLRQPEIVDWSIHWTYFWQAIITVIIPLIALFSFARSLRESIMEILFLSKTKNKTSL